MVPIALCCQADPPQVQRLIEAGIKEGATLVTGRPGRPEHLNRGYYVRPTVFGHVTPGMTIEKEEIFGPVLSVIAYKDDEDAVKIANDTVYGLAAYVQSGDIEHACKVARQLRAGQVSINYPEWDTFAPFGATNSPATAANTPIGRSTISSRSRASSATGCSRP